MGWIWSCEELKWKEERNGRTGEVELETAAKEPGRCASRELKSSGWSVRLIRAL